MSINQGWLYNHFLVLMAHKNYY
uniref:Uncharacterized protein n=1 Tax=Rhizophora mucronata TaxID=61149 RepID=A0A2P2PXY9_RHIMU